MSTSRKIRYQLEWLAVRWLAFSIPLLPRPFAQAIGSALGAVAFRFDKRGRRTSLENLELVFGDEKSDEERLKIAKESYRCFARVVMDQFWSPRLSAANADKIFKIEIEDEAAFEAIKKTGGVFVTPHYSNFEWIALSGGFLGLNFTIVARDFKNPKLTAIYRKNRELSGHEVIGQRGALLRLLKNLKRGGFVGFLSDLTIPPSKAATIIECFGKKVSVTGIHAELMKRTGLPLIPCLCMPKPDGTYLFHAYSPIELGPNDSKQEVAQACWDCFEEHIRKNPAPWLWMYKHFRYIPKDSDADEYPSYAQINTPFHRLEERLEEEEA